jgi:hypothetical protein
MMVEGQWGRTQAPMIEASASAVGLIVDVHSHMDALTTVGWTPRNFIASRTLSASDVQLA